MKKYLAISVAISLISFLLIYSIFQNYLVYSSIRKMDLSKASSHSKTAIILPRIINLITFKQIDVINLWDFALRQLPIINELEKDTKEYLQTTINAEEINDELAQKIINNLEKINNELNKIDAKQINEFKYIFNNLNIIAKKLLNGDQSYLVILQNSDEIRASGGFLGSFFVLEFKNGKMSPIEIQDVYAPDGQFQGFVEAPKGLDKYLSSGKGMRLPDANWFANFPDSAEQILYFFKEVENKDYQGVIALNLGIVEELIGITGDIYLPDYDKTVNKNNFAAIAREDRNEFFPGSQEKINFLNHFFKIFKIKLTETIEQNPQRIIGLLQMIAKNKDLQIYSKDKDLEELVNKYQLSGKMENKAELYYFLVESNVGINKSNRLVDRQVIIELNEQTEKITINFQNSNSMPYVNYYRLYTNQETELLDIEVNQEKITEIDQKIITTKDGESFKEIGFLVPILPKNPGSVEISLQSKLSMENKKNILIQKQSGLQKTDYLIKYLDQNKNIQLISDQLINFD